LPDPPIRGAAPGPYPVNTAAFDAEAPEVNNPTDELEGHIYPAPADVERAFEEIFRTLAGLRESLQSLIDNDHEAGGWLDTVHGCDNLSGSPIRKNNQLVE